MRIGIIGSRSRNSYGDYLQVENLIRGLRDMFGADLVICSGACPKGADNHAAETCKSLGIPLVEFPAIFTNVNGIENYARAYYARNSSVAEFSERIYAQMTDELDGGTRNTVDTAL